MTNEIRLSPKGFVKILFAIMIGLAILHVASYIPMARGFRDEPVQLLNLDGEQNLSSLFSSALLWICSMLLGCIAAATAKKNMRLEWMGLAGIFCLLGVDEFASLHERLGGMVDRCVESLGLGCFAWMIPYSLLLVLFGVVYWRFLFGLPPETRKRMVMAGTIYVGGALGFEMVGGAWVLHEGAGWVYYVFVTCEELLEMTGSILFIYALSSYIEKYMPGFRLRITSS
ncbi:MAG: hypothetical protein K9M54_12655 [Kiritimatiellales bacterium]|nr:hypothetical protein [Kiritimatiellales bacterium]MCF7864113.1 hypothetical protein [Kiritimatiellales bacterium]